MQIHKEIINSDFEGTIIDLETIGLFIRGYGDSRQYKEIIPVIFGFIDNKSLNIFYIQNQDKIPKLNQEIKKVLLTLKRPFHAFNSDFERGVLFHSLGFPVEFESELNIARYEKKEHVVKAMNIPQYGDPFEGEGLKCMNSWLAGDFKKAVEHNRSCLLKERDILLKRGFRKPDELRLVID